MVVVHWITGLFPLITHGKNFTSMVDNFREGISISGNKLTFDDFVQWHVAVDLPWSRNL